jgi:hypothetical protein
MALTMAEKSEANRSLIKKRLEFQDEVVGCHAEGLSVVVIASFKLKSVLMPVIETLVRDYESLRVKEAKHRDSWSARIYTPTTLDDTARADLVAELVRSLAAKFKQMHSFKVVSGEVGHAPKF